MTTVGITGHRALPEAAQWSWVREELDAALVALEPPIVGVSSLAEGADQCFAEAVLAAGGRLHAVLAFEHFGESLEDDDHAAFAALLQGADEVEVVDPQPTRDLAYLAAGLRVVELVDVLFAVWDGKPARGTGGTAEVVERSLAIDTPVLHIDTSDSTVRWL
jgi:hypothetical protein